MTTAGGHTPHHTISISRPRIAASRGMLSGGLLVLLGIWGGLVPFWGPQFDYAYTPDTTWTWTWGRLWLEVLSPPRRDDPRRYRPGRRDHTRGRGGGGLACRGRRGVVHPRPGPLHTVDGQCSGCRATGGRHHGGPRCTRDRFLLRARGRDPVPRCGRARPVRHRRAAAGHGAADPGGVGREPKRRELSREEPNRRHTLL